MVCPQIAEQTEDSEKNRKLKLILKTVRSILFNPILFMTVLGIGGGVAFPNGLPIYISGILKVISIRIIRFEFDLNNFILGFRKFFFGNSFVSTGPSYAWHRKRGKSTWILNAICIDSCEIVCIFNISTNMFTPN